MPFLPRAPFAGETSDSILVRMLAAVSDDFVKLEGGFIHDTLAPAALGIEQLYMHLETHIWNCFPQLANTDALDALALQLAGITRTANETDTHLRSRLLAALAIPTGGGTRTDYARILAGVLGAGAFSVVNTAGALTLYLADVDHSPADSALIATAQAAIDADAPVGLSVTVDNAVMEYEDDFSLVLTTNAVTPAARTIWLTNLREWFAQNTPGTDFSITAAMAFAGIPSAYYVSHDFAGLPTTRAMATPAGIFRASSLSVS